jgi:hypothetical protein
LVGLSLPPGKDGRWHVSTMSSEISLCKSLNDVSLVDSYATSNSEQGLPQELPMFIQEKFPVICECKIEEKPRLFALHELLSPIIHLSKAKIPIKVLIEALSSGAYDLHGPSPQHRFVVFIHSWMF